MTNNHDENIETVASAQPFLNAEKEQMKELTKTARQLGGEVAESSEKLSPEIQARLDRLEEIEAAEKGENLVAEEEFEEKAEDVSPEIQAKLDRLEKIEAAEKGENLVAEEEFEEKAEDVSPEIQAKLDRLEEIEAAERAEQEAEEKDPDYVKFNKPYHFEGKEYRGVKLEFDEMTGADILEAEEEFITTKTQTAAQTPLKELSKGYLAFFAARACAQPVDFILGLDGKSFARITRRAQSFLLSED